MTSRNVRVVSWPGDVVLPHRLTACETEKENEMVWFLMPGGVSAGMTESLAYVDKKCARQNFQLASKQDLHVSTHV